MALYATIPDATEQVMTWLAVELNISKGDVIPAALTALQELVKATNSGLTVGATKQKDALEIVYDLYSR